MDNSQVPHKIQNVLPMSMQTYGQMFLCVSAASITTCIGYNFGVHFWGSWNNTGSDSSFSNQIFKQKLTCLSTIIWTFACTEKKKRQGRRKNTCFNMFTLSIFFFNVQLIQENYIFFSFWAFIMPGIIHKNFFQT